ncbi:MAG: GNAT family N-acetyltransferase [Actinomycetota bacterium]|nr:GNAT family N-acetyltransferase [Actinomycetota bacterium]
MPDIHLLTTAEASPELLMEIRRLLVQAFEGDFSQEDWEHTIGGWHVVVADGDATLSHAAVVPRALEVADRPLRAGYVEGVGTAPARQREGLGSIAMAEASELIRSHFEMGALSTGHHKFYTALGWERWLGPTYVRRGSEAVRTEEEDDGVMVLRFGSSTDVDLTAPISCEGRHGDDW